MAETLEETRPNLSDAMAAADAAEARAAAPQKAPAAPNPHVLAEEAQRLRDIRLPLWNAFLTARFAAGGNWELDAQSLMAMDVLTREVERAAAGRART
jgi:hypothetical protein